MSSSIKQENKTIFTNKTTRKKEPIHNLVVALLLAVGSLSFLNILIIFKFVGRNVNTIDPVLLLERSSSSFPSSESVLSNQQEESSHFLSYAEYWNMDTINKTLAVTANDATATTTTTTAATTPTKNKRMISSHHDKTFNDAHPMPPQHKWLRKGRKGAEAGGDGIYDSQMLNDASTHATKASNATTFIPKIINKVYIEKSGLFPTDQEMNQMGSLVEAQKSWSIMNPGYAIRYFNLNLCREYIMEYYHPVFLRAFDCIEAFSGKVNLFRMLVVYAEGGWYSDWKQVCLKPNLLDEIGRGVDFYGVWDYGNNGVAQDKCVQNCFFGATSHHPLIADMIRAILTNIQAEVYNVKHALYTTGPCTFGQVFAKYMNERKDEDIDGRLRMGYFKNSVIKSAARSDEKFVTQKCEGCRTSSQYWREGNNYNKMFEERKYYCQDAKSLFQTAVMNVERNRLLL